jgi:hypothetical protein
VANDKSRKALHDKVRIMTAEVDMYKRQREFEQGTPHRLERHAPMTHSGLVSGLHHPLHVLPRSANEDRGQV